VISAPWRPTSPTGTASAESRSISPRNATVFDPHPPLALSHGSAPVCR
jgi:hypothetical protein